MYGPGLGSKCGLGLSSGFSKLKPDLELRVGLGLGLVGKLRDTKFKLKLCRQKCLKKVQKAES